MGNQFFVIVDEEDSDKFRRLQYNTYGKLLKKLGYPNTRFWGFTDKDKENFEKIYSRDTIPYMKPDYRSFNDVHNDLSLRDPNPKVICFTLLPSIFIV